MKQSALPPSKRHVASTISGSTRGTFTVHIRKPDGLLLSYQPDEAGNPGGPVEFSSVRYAQWVALVLDGQLQR